jgi:hypothetical protein
VNFSLVALVAESNAFLRMLFLQRPQLHLAALQRLDRSQGGIGSTQGGHDGDAVLHCGDVDITFILTRILA